MKKPSSTPAAARAGLQVLDVGPDRRVPGLGPGFDADGPAPAGRRPVGDTGVGIRVRRPRERRR